MTETETLTDPDHRTAVGQQSVRLELATKLISAAPAPREETALRVEELSKHFMASVDRKELPKARGLQALWRKMAPPKKRKTAVDKVSFSIARGEIFGVVGHNGSGKSTLIRMLSTLLTPDEGLVRIFGYDPVREPYMVQRLINRVSVDAAFFKKLSAFENLLYGARLYGVPDKLALKRSEEILAALGLEEGRLTDSLQELSRGMQQKVAVARALLTSPVLLLLDEPTTGLDPKSKREVQQFVLDLRRVHDATVLLTSHDMDEVERLCERISIMNDGRIIALGTAAELKQMVLERIMARAGRDNGQGVKAERAELIRSGAATVDMEDVFIELTGKLLSEDTEEAK
jgi:ABC-2 type transport system ATP-binding protein